MTMNVSFELLCKLPGVAESVVAVAHSPCCFLSKSLLRYFSKRALILASDPCFVSLLPALPNGGMRLTKLFFGADVTTACEMEGERYELQPFTSIIYMNHQSEVVPSTFFVQLTIIEAAALSGRLW